MPTWVWDYCFLPMLLETSTNKNWHKPSMERYNVILSQTLFKVYLYVHRSKTKMASSWLTSARTMTGPTRQTTKDTRNFYRRTAGGKWSGKSGRKTKKKTWKSRTCITGTFSSTRLEPTVPHSTTSLGTKRLGKNILTFRIFFSYLMNLFNVLGGIQVYLYFFTISHCYYNLKH